MHRRFLRVGLLLPLALLAPAAHAVTTLTVDLSKPIGPVKHVASGSLYGVTEMLPADVAKLIAPLHPNMFNNPAANVQQPHGDAILVAARVAATGARVTIRLADWFPGWPYGFTNMNDWFDKLGQTVTRKQAAAVDNFYAYEIWNEPDGTWKSSSVAFNDFWKQSYQKLRALDPEAKIIGPSISYYNRSYLSSFLSFAKSNDCVPDIIGWHELGGGDVGGNIQNYRALEQQLGIGPLPISINEYSGKDHIDDEGQPGASAPIIAKFERFQVDTACISYWDVAHAGRLGSLLATDTTPNGGWWFYKWYGDMAGTMVTTVPPAANDVSSLDGFANLDDTAHSASVVFGGVNDGSVQLVVKGFAAAPVLGTKVHAVVEHTPFVNRTTAVSAANTVSTADVSVTNDQVAVTVANTNGTDGYRLSLTALDGVAGAPATGGMGGLGGAPAGGSPGSGGAPHQGGAGGTGGGAGASGANSRAGAGGTEISNAGRAASAGTSSGTAGAPSFGGTSAAGGTARGGAGGTSTSGGGTGASSGTGGGSGAGAAAGSTSNDGSDSGCGCAVAGRSSARPFALAALVAAGWFARRRRAQAS